MGFPYQAEDKLTAADLNASSGLVFIKSVTVTGTPTSITVTNVFSSTFRNYKVVMSNSQNSTYSTPVYIQFGTNAGYFGNYWDGSTTTNISGGSNGIAVGSTSTGAPISGFEAIICNPNVAVRSTIRGHSTNSLWQGGGQDVNTSQHTGFTVNAGGTITFSTGGVITVYGLNDG